MNSNEGNQSEPDAFSSSQWQQLTSYIVGLEKEVEYYKQLVQDVQTNQLKVNQETALEATIKIPNKPKAALSGEPLSAVEEGSRASALLCVFSYLSMRDLCRASRVSREWLSVARNPKLWRKVVLSETMLHPMVFSVHLSSTIFYLNIHW